MANCCDFLNTKYSHTRIVDINPWLLIALSRGTEYDGMNHSGNGEKNCSLKPLQRNGMRSSLPAEAIGEGGSANPLSAERAVIIVRIALVPFSRTLLNLLQPPEFRHVIHDFHTADDYRPLCSATA